MSKFIGIDLGTTFSAVAQVDETGRATIIHNEDGINITPSVVSFEGATVPVGEEARKVLWADSNTIGRFKRDMGSDKTYALGGAERTPTFLSSLVLKKLKQFAENTIGEIEQAVVTVPANFASEAREATLKAARDAGLIVEYIINEPTAAALYYAVQSDEDLNGKYAIYDLGGGTFDVSIVNIEGNNVEVLASDGVSQLGGDDFDQALFQLVQAKAKEKTGNDLSSDVFSKNDAEGVKITLSKREVAKVRIPGVANIEVTRAEFEEAISALVSQAEMLCDCCMEDAGLACEDINEVFLVGGSTRVPSVVESVTRVFKQQPKATANVDEVVALGAALYAQFKLSGTGSNDDKTTITERTGKAYGTFSNSFNNSRGRDEHVNTIVIRRGTIIPTSFTKSFYTMHHGQTGVDCSVNESPRNDTDPKWANTIWSGSLEDLPPERPEGCEIQVTFEYTENQTMKCTFLDVESGKTQEADISLNAANSDNSVNESNPDDFKIE